jgi:2-isopropylmalate synthase
LAALEAGARQVECTINGIGERAGNASLEEIIMALHVRADRLPFETNVVTTELYPASQLLSSIVGFDVQPNKAIVGRNAFAHEAGIHQDGMLKDARTYEINIPDVTRSRCVTWNWDTTLVRRSSMRRTGGSRIWRTKRNGFTIRT